MAGRIVVSILFVVAAIWGLSLLTTSNPATDAAAHPEADNSPPMPKINFITSPAQPADSYRVTEFAWGCPSPLAAAEMQDLAERTGDFGKTIKNGALITPLDQYEDIRGARLNCIPLLPTAAFALQRGTNGAPIFRSATDVFGNETISVAGAMLIGGSDRPWTFYVPISIVENAQSGIPLAAPASAPDWQPDDRYLPVNPHYKMPDGALP